jgi:hypothetical protein
MDTEYEGLGVRWEVRCGELSKARCEGGVRLDVRFDVRLDVRLRLRVEDGVK